MDLEKYKTKKKRKKLKKNVRAKSVCEKYKGIIQIVARIILLKGSLFLKLYRSNSSLKNKIFNR